jgi:acyl carrier protein
MTGPASRDGGPGPTATERRLQEIAAQRLKVRPEEVPLDQDLLEELPLDSLDVAAVIAEVDDEFAPVRVAESPGELRTLRDVAAYIDRERARA